MFEILLEDTNIKRKVMSMIMVWEDDNGVDNDDYDNDDDGDNDDGDNDHYHHEASPWLQASLW